jgi:hypothetical protein
MVSPEVESVTQYVELLIAVLSVVAVMGGVWMAGIRRGLASDAKIAALSVALVAEAKARNEEEKELSAALAAQTARVDKLRDWQQREIGKSERSDVRAIPSNPGDTRG